MRRRHHEYIDRLCQHLHDPKPSLNAIISHIGFGFHERLSADYQYRHYTFLRDPVERVLSHYHFQIQRGQLDPLTSLETFVREDLGRACNVQTAFLGGLAVQHNLDGITLSLDLYTEALLERAKANLRRMAAFGLTERFDESLLRFRQCFGWELRRMFYIRRRVGQLRTATPEHPDHVLRLIRQFNELDLELYRYAQVLFDEQRAALPPNGSPNVKTFQRLNAVYSNVFSLVKPRLRPGVRKVRAMIKRR